MTIASDSSAATTPTPTAPDPIDIAALRERYRIERDKRLREDGNEQYVEVQGDFSHYAEDPYVAPGFTRAPLADEVEVVVIGGGFGGLLAGARLREAGVQSLRMIEAAGDFGGTWYWNRYPGAACDIEAYVYLPLLEELGVMPTRRFATGAEILAHAQAVGRHFDLYRDACFQTRVSGLDWDEADARWVIRTHRGDRMRARFVIMSNGPLNRPKLPGIPGITHFKGHTFHTSRWDYAYTGGGPEGGLDRLHDKRVAVIGTGATAVQCLPHLAASAKQVVVFQRTPSSIDLRNDRPTDPEWAASLKPGWQRERIENFAIILSGGMVAVDMVRDGWTEAARNFRAIAMSDRSVLASPESIAAAMELSDARKMTQVRARVDEVVQDPGTAESLKPWYRQFCKRPCFHDDYLQAFNRPNVKLVDTQGQGVERFTESAVVFGGVAHEVDAVIFATGFEVGTGYTRRSGYDLVGRGGVTLSDKWRDGMRTVHGMLSNGFPNLIIFGTPQSGQTANFVHALDEQGRHAAYLITQAQQRGVRTLEPTLEEEAAWVKTIIESTRRNEAFLASCTPGYYNNEGKPGARGVQNSPYGLGAMAFFKLLATWRDSDRFSGLQLTFEE
ncbi:MAG: NAD(P)/FAD-dependent oxidoreductase [Rhizobacter sp.]|nr:NAD(P)/FAD-dependent oxidoreductase [Rhizobacter sp.]